MSTLSLEKSVQFEPDYHFTDLIARILSRNGKVLDVKYKISFQHMIVKVVSQYDTMIFEDQLQYCMKDHFLKKWLIKNELNAEYLIYDVSERN